MPNADCRNIEIGGKSLFRHSAIRIRHSGCGLFQQPANRPTVAAITNDSDERALIEAAQADPARFVDLYERHFHRVYAYVIRRTGSRPEAEDITSEVSERALVNLPRFEWRGV